MKKLKKGFTIVELVIVIAVIAILAAVLIPTFTSATEKAKESAALQNARNAVTQISAYDITATDNKVGNEYIVEVNGYFFKVVNGSIAKVASKTGYTTDYTESNISDLQNGVQIWLPTQA